MTLLCIQPAEESCTGNGRTFTQLSLLTITSGLTAAVAKSPCKTLDHVNVKYIHTEKWIIFFSYII